MPRRPTLYARLLWAQVLTACVLVSLFAVAFYVERNRTVAELVAERWLPVLRQHLVTKPQFRQRSPIVQRDGQPERVFVAPGWAPRVAALREVLRAGGVPVQEVAFSLRPGEPMIWLHVPGAGQRERWLGLPDHLVERRLPWRLLGTLVLALALLMLTSAWLSRQFSRPLEQLRRRIEAPEAALPPLRGATAEMVAIDAAWQGAQARLAEQARERSLLLAGVSHDLRSPLARIRMAAELLPDEPALAARRATITRNVALADRLLQSFLDHVRAGELPLDEPVDLAERARAAVAALDQPAEALHLQAPDQLLLPRCNAVLIDSLLFNLLDNAFKHGRPPVQLRLWLDAQGPQAQLCLQVQDAGTGIPPEQREQALRAFARGDAARSRPGTGLGLSVVRQVVERLGGVLSFELAPGRHVVSVRLPLRD